MRALLQSLPAINAALNTTSALLLGAGYLFIRRKMVAQHQRCMLSACATSGLFLIGYLALRYSAGMTRFSGQGWIRPIYFTILTSHTVLAACILPLVLVSLWRALSHDVARHVRVARWALPLWLYVSVTGVLVYWILYHLYPQV